MAVLLYLPVPFLLDAHVGSFAAGTGEGFRFLEEKNRPAAGVAGKLVKEYVAVGQIYLDQLLAMLAKAWKEPDSLVIFSNAPADAAALIAAGIALKDAIFTHLRNDALFQPTG
ncbi:MAG: hypothetical protein HZB44_08125 [Actinobacteria bacterium]|nr:hypothetical protein [Actinomycetota bacterium]